MNLKGIGMSLYIHVSLLLACGLIYLISSGAGSRSDAVSAAAFILAAAYAPMMGAVVWGTKRAHWVGPRMQQMENSRIARVVLGATILFWAAVRHAKRNDTVLAALYAVAAVVAVGWLFSAAYEGASKYDIRKVKPLVVDLALSGTIGKAVIALSIFPMLVFTFHFLFTIPFVLLFALAGSGRGSGVLTTINLLSYLPSIYSAIEVCRRIWNQSRV